MFENVGTKLKLIAIVLFWVEMIATLITGIIVWANSYGLGFLWFLLIAVGGGLSAYLSALMMYALGEVADNSTENTEKEHTGKENTEEEDIEKESIEKENTLTTTNNQISTSSPIVEPTVSKIFTNPTSRNDFFAGETVKHDKHGVGRIVFFTREEITVEFESGDKETFKVEKAVQEFKIIK